MEATLKTTRTPIDAAAAQLQPAAARPRAADAGPQPADLPSRQRQQQQRIHQLRSIGAPGHQTLPSPVAQLGGAFSRPAAPQGQNRGIDPLKALELKQQAEQKRKQAEALKQKRQQMESDAQTREIWSGAIGSNAQYPGAEYTAYQMSEDAQKQRRKATKLRAQIQKTSQQADNLEMYSGVFSGTVKHVPTESEGEQ